MELINLLIREVREGSSKLYVSDKEVAELSEHFCILATLPVSRREVEAAIMAGSFRLIGVPVEVVRHDA